MTTKVVVPWHKGSQLAVFLDQWDVSKDDSRMIFQQDSDKSGCARTKNRGIRRAMDSGAEIIIVLDDDCFPEEKQTLDEFIEAHVRALEPQPVEMFEVVTDPPSRGTPYFNRTITMPVAASMGFWTFIGDYDAPAQLIYGAQNEMQFFRYPIHGKYFPLCGMNLAFRASEWPWCQFVEIPRFDDIWQGFMWQRRAYAEGKCFNLGGPLVYHSRQSNVWANLHDESKHLERNETIWKEIHDLDTLDYEEMKRRLVL